MSDYGSPGPQGPYGQSPQSSSAPSSTSDSSDSSGDTTQWVLYTNYAAAGLGVLAFIWGFLTWLKSGDGLGSSTQSGYAGIGGVVVGLSLAAGLLAGAAVLEKKDVTLVPSALAAAALLVALGELISHGDGVDAGVALYLAFVTTILQTAVLVYGWMLTSGRMSAPAKSPKPQQNPWAGQQPGGPQGGPQGGYGGYPQAPGQYGGGQYQPPPAPSYPAPGQFGPPPSPPGQQGGPQFGGQYGPPPSPPVYGAPSGLGPSAPPQSPAQPPSQPAQPSQDANPYQPPSAPSGESGSGYGEATRHIPRYSPPEQDSQDGSSGS